MPEVSRITYHFSEIPEDNKTMPVLRVEVRITEKEGEGMTKSAFRDPLYCWALATIIYVLCILAAGLVLLFMEVFA